MASRVADLERWWDEEIGKTWLGQTGIGEELVMTMAGGQPETARQPKHSEILLSIYHLRCIVDRYESFLEEIREVEDQRKIDKHAVPDGPEHMALAQFMVEGGLRIQKETERLDQILHQIREIIL